MNFRKGTTAYVSCLLVGLCALTVSAQDDEPSKKPKVLGIGSAAPALDIEHWVQDGNGKFDPVSEFQAGKVYVVEFWATWCGPCISSMPHIAELQSEHMDTVQVVSITRESLETVEKFLEKPVRGSKDENETYRDLTSVYCLTADPDNSSSNDYMKAAGRNGIPCAFLVGKTGEIEWIGHPMRMDDPLDQVLAGTWDREAFKKEFEVQQRVDLAMRELSGLMRAKKYKQAVAVVDSLLEDSPSEVLKQRLHPIRFQILSGSEEMQDELITFTRQILADESIGGHTSYLMTKKIYELTKSEAIEFDEKMLQEVVSAAAKAAKKESGGNRAIILDGVAHLQQLLGDVKGAMETQSEAVSFASPSLRPRLQKFLDELTEEVSPPASDE